MPIVNYLASLIRHPICSVFGWKVTQMDDSTSVRLKYERDHDLLSVWLRQVDPRHIDTVEVEPGVCVRLDEEGRVVGVEVVDAAARLQKDASTLENKAFAIALVRSYGRRVLAGQHT